LQVSILPADSAQQHAAEDFSERKKFPPGSDYDLWRRARLAERLRLAHTRQDVWNYLITVVVQATSSNTEALADTLATLSCQTYRNIEILVAGESGTSLPAASDFAGLRGLFVEPALDPLDMLSDPATDRLWRGSHLVFAAAGTTFDPDAFELMNRMLSPLQGSSPPDLVICDHDRCVTPQASPEPCFLPGWDPDLIATMDYVGSAFMASRRMILERRFAGRADSLHDWLISLATEASPVAAAHLGETVIHLVCDLPRPAPAPAVLSRPARAGSVAIVIPNRDQPDLLQRCIRCLEFLEGPVPELVIVDHTSTDPATLAIYAHLQQRYGARIERFGGHFNFSRMVNLGVAATTAEVILLMNNDIEVTIPGQLETIVEHAMRPEVGVAGARLLYPDGHVQHAGVLLRMGSNRHHLVLAHHVLRGAPGEADGYLHALRTVRNYQAVTGALFATRRTVFENAGGFDEVNLPVEYNDVDYCLKLRAMGLRVVAVPTDGIIHPESSTRGNETTTEVRAMRTHAMAVIADRWRDAVERDPFRNPWADLGDVPEVRFPWTADNR
jgi:GT2 family glycosyltransferase